MKRRARGREGACLIAPKFNPQRFPVRSPWSMYFGKGLTNTFPAILPHHHLLWRVPITKVQSGVYYRYNREELHEAKGPDRPTFTGSDETATHAHGTRVVKLDRSRFRDGSRGARERVVDSARVARAAPRSVTLTRTGYRPVGRRHHAHAVAGRTA